MPLGLNFVLETGFALGETWEQERVHHIENFRIKKCIKFSTLIAVRVCVCLPIGVYGVMACFGYF